VEKTNPPDRVQGLWAMAELARWGIVPFPKNWLNITERIWRTDIFGEAARDLEMLDLERDRGPIHLFDGTVFDPDDPIAYLKSLKIKRQIRVEEINLDAIALTA
jgi:nitrate/nitrite transport system ATP-binding protein